MRNGILLAEDTPVNIMQKYGRENLEEAFLVLCQKHGTSEEADATVGRVSGQRYMSNAMATQSLEAGRVQKRELEADSSTPAQGENPAITTKPKLAFEEPKPESLLQKLSFTTQIRMKALLTKNLLQLIRQPS